MGKTPAPLAVLTFTLLALPATALTTARLPLSRTAWSSTNYDRLVSLLEDADAAASLEHGRAPVAAFDADGTLWAGDAFGALAIELLRRGQVDSDAVQRVDDGYKNSQEDEREVWLIESFKLFKGLTLEQLLDAADAAWDSGLSATLRPEMEELVRALRDRGWRVLIVTASPTEAVLRGAMALGVPEGDVLGVRFETEGGGVGGERGTRDAVITGRMSPVMPVTWREGKAAALEAIGVAGRLRLAVGNSMDDVPMIRLACAPKTHAAAGDGGGGGRRGGGGGGGGGGSGGALPSAGGTGMLCVPRPNAAEGPGTGAAEGKPRIVRVAEDEGYLLHEATAGSCDYAAIEAGERAT